MPGFVVGLHTREIVPVRRGLTGTLDDLGGFTAVLRPRGCVVPSLPAPETAAP
jgi:hypothetical protein